MAKLDAHVRPELEAPPSGTMCPRCGDELRIVGFCASCYEMAMRAREAKQHARGAQLAEARRRARTWQLGRHEPVHQCQCQEHDCARLVRCLTPVGHGGAPHICSECARFDHSAGARS